MNRQVYINLPVSNLQETIAFWTALGFQFNQQFTDENATCMIISEHNFVMLLKENFFKTFIDNEIGNGRQQTQVINAIQFENKETVDKLLEIAMANGATEPRALLDHGWMYNRAMRDRDGHFWEFFWMDTSQIPAEGNQ
jgi:predicted lactoylglutathione lyase